MHRPMRKGEHFLLFLYPPSRLGLTSPVRGAQGQVPLDAGGTRAGDTVDSPGEPWTVAVHGADHTGIVHGITSALADAGGNVVDRQAPAVTRGAVSPANTQSRSAPAHAPGIVNVKQLERAIRAARQE